MSDEDDEGSSLSSSDHDNSEPLNPPVSSSIGKHIYFDDEEEHGDHKTQQIIERETPSTVRVDGSDLITRCKDFLPLLANFNPKETTTVEKDEDEQIILPEDSLKESGEASTTSGDDDDEKSKEIVKKKRKKKKKKKKKKLKIEENIVVNNQDLPAS